MLMIVIVLIIIVAITDTKAGLKEQGCRRKRDILAHRKTNAELEEKLYLEYLQKCNDKQQAYNEAIAEITRQGFEPCCPFDYYSSDKHRSSYLSRYEPYWIRSLKKKYDRIFCYGKYYNEKHNQNELMHLIYDNWPTTDYEWDCRYKRDEMIADIRQIGTWMKLTPRPQDVYQITDVSFDKNYTQAFYTVREITRGTTLRIRTNSKAIIWM